MKIVAIGGAGHVGNLIGPELTALGQIVVADRPGSRAVDWGENIAVDVLDRPSLDAALRGADAMIYLAMGGKNDWGSPEWARSQFDVNVTGLFTALEAAAAHGVGHCVIAGSMSVYADFLAVEDPSHLDATEAYGLTKRLGEDVARAAVARHGIDVTVLRLVLPVEESVWVASTDDKHAHVMTTGGDTARAFIAALRTRPPGFVALPVSGDLSSTVVDWRPTQRVLGWAPTAVRDRAESDV